MTNELYDPEMLQKHKRAGKIVFEVKDSVDIVWMSQETMASFFDVKKKDIILNLSQVLKQNNLDKSKHIRTVSYVKNSLSNAVSIQERQYSFTVICLLGFVLVSEVATAFRLWVVSDFERYLKWGIHSTPTRIKSSEKRKAYAERLFKKLL